MRYNSFCMLFEVDNYREKKNPASHYHKKQDRSEKKKKYEDVAIGVSVAFLGSQWDGPRHSHHREKKKEAQKQETIRNRDVEKNNRDQNKEWRRIFTSATITFRTSA